MEADVSKETRKKKIRRQNKQVLKFGRKAKTTHRLLGGRTGTVHAKKLKSRHLTPNAE